MTHPSDAAVLSGDALDAEAIYQRLQAAVAVRMQSDAPPVLVGIHRGGAWIAERLRASLCPAAPWGTLSSAFHRDDFSERGLRSSEGGGTRLDFAVDGANILVVDDILYTGRTVRAVINELFDYGRPRRIELAVLLDRGGRELPIQADFVGAVVPLQPTQQFVLGRAASGLFTLAIETD
jgi:pyrimidine operon attenuation protein/uracil phosphoribosyltransferase